jgi:hypothetical protein
LFVATCLNKKCYGKDTVNSNPSSVLRVSLFIIGGSLELTSGVLPLSLLAVHKLVFVVTKNDTQRLSKGVSLGGGSVSGSLELTSGVLPSSLLAVHKPVFTVTKNDTQHLSKGVSLEGGSVIVDIDPALSKQESM